jgi:hypothetical protein
MISWNLASTCRDSSHSGLSPETPDQATVTKG